MEARNDGDLREDLWKLRCEDSLVDVILEVNAEDEDEDFLRISAHRVVLAAGSEYFKAMFSSGLAESSKRTVRISGLAPSALASLIEYLYLGRVNVSTENVESLFVGAHMLGISGVEETCEDFLINQLCTNNALGIRRFGQTHRRGKLSAAATAFVHRHFQSIVDSAEFRLLSPSELGPLLNSDDLNIDDEVHVYAALMSWLKADPQQRASEMPKLLHTIRFGLFPPELLTSLPKRQPLLREGGSCRQLYVEALETALSSDRERARKSTLGTLYAIGGRELRSPTISTPSATPLHIHRYDSRTDSWETVGKMNEARQQLGVAAMGNKLILVGGRQDLKVLNQVDTWDVDSGSFSRLPNLTTGRHGLAVGVLAGCLYAVGGHDGWAYLSSVERWESSQRRWSEVTPMFEPRSGAAVAVLDDRLYVAGGRDHTHILSSVEMYNPHTNSWSSCAPMIQRRSNLGLCSAGGYLWAVGGQASPSNHPSPPRLSSIERYSPSENVWEAVKPDLAVGRDGLGLACLGQTLFAVGGFDGTDFVGTVEGLSIGGQAWERFADLPFPATSLRLALLPKPTRIDALKALLESF